MTEINFNDYFYYDETSPSCLRWKVDRRAGKNHVRYPVWRTTWVSVDGKKREKSFSILRYGEDKAFELACSYRTQIIAALNYVGQGYTEQHGVKKHSETENSQPSCD